MKNDNFTTVVRWNGFVVEPAYDTLHHKLFFVRSLMNAKGYATFFNMDSNLNDSTLESYNLVRIHFNGFQYFLILRQTLTKENFQI
ncbi:CLUMA_CG010518, isoform A [Clunio marinus]|uniref:CLUMA_CG010518, isoform A n=1 Tax=Clunio marinus TaxID=568069 RepID=A0A1J1IF92_9DIPT|nr:CLUMA_CG010518, isoform A [Clunio marinus]